MASQSLLGLILQIQADPSSAQSTIDNFTAKSSQRLEDFAKSGRKAGDDIEKGLINSHQSVHLLAEEMGIHLPRAVVGAVSEMLPSIDQLGGAMLGVFAVKEVYEFGKAALEMMHDLEGETKELKKDWEEVISEQEKLLRHPKTIGDAQKDIAETNRRLADAAKHIADLKQQLNDLPFGAAIKAAEISHFITQWEDEQKMLTGRLVAQIDIYGQLGAAATKAARQASEAAERQAAAEKRAWEHAKHLVFLTGQQFIPVVDGLTKSIDVDVVSLRLWEAEMERTATVLPMVRQNIQGLVVPITQVNYVLHEQVSVTKTVAKALQTDVASQFAQAAISTAGIIGGRREQAGVEAVWETAQGIAKLAEGTWPPNPAAIAAAVLHFEAAAQYAIIAGKHGGSRPGVGGGGAGSYSRSGVSGRGSGSDRVGLPPPATLAPGADGGSGGRFGSGTVIIHGTTEFENYVATAINNAVSRGVNVTATSSQQGSPVGH